MKKIYFLLICGLMCAAMGVSANDYIINSGNITIPSDNVDHTISGTGTSTGYTIVVSTGYTGTITLTDVNISSTTNCAFLINTGSTVNLILVGDNILTSGTSQAGIEVPNGATLNITGSGTLKASGGGSTAANGAGGAGIGGHGGKPGQSSGNIKIDLTAPGKIEATGGSATNNNGGGGAGIGGGGGGNDSGGGASGSIELVNGEIIAIGGNGHLDTGGNGGGGAAGIGGGGGGGKNAGGAVTGSISIEAGVTGTSTGGSGGLGNGADVGNAGGNGSNGGVPGTVTIGGTFNNTLESIAVTTNPTKMVYIVGEAFDPTNMEVTATYKNGNSDPVTGYTTGPASFSTSGSITVTVTYTEAGITKQTDFQVTVNKPALSGSAAISGDNEIGEILTVDPALITGGDGAFSYQWQAGGVDIPGANDATYALTSAEAGKAITCIIERANASATGFVTAEFDGGLSVPYNITITNIGNDTNDTEVTLSDAIGRTSDLIRLDYVLGNGGGTPTNTLSFTGGTGLVNLLTAGASITQNYTVIAGDAVNGVITITATFLHSGLLPQTLTFSGNLTKTYLDLPFSTVATGLGSGAITYGSSDALVATIDASGEVTIVGAGTATITASIAADVTYDDATASYVLKVDKAPQTTVPLGILGKTDETFANANDGTITGVTTLMEYKLDTDAIWLPVTTNPITGLAPGTYEVRFAETTNFSPGATSTITILAGPIPVISITVSSKSGATTITTNGGTLVLTADVFPTNATNQAVTWSVINGSGSAIIGLMTSDALLTATGNGTVKVRATATDGSGIYGELTVTISGQTVLYAPGISGATAMTLNRGYQATSTEPYNISGTSMVTVTKISGDSHITWNSAKNTIDIAEGLTIGVYEVKLQAKNSVSTFIFTFVLKVQEPQYFIELVKYIGGSVSSVSHAPYLGYEGETITLNITQDKDFVLESIHVYNMFDRNVEVPLTGTGLTRTFTMPAHHVTIVAAFRDPRGVGIEETQNIKSLQAYAQNGTLYVDGLTFGKQWSVYNVTGRMIYQGIAGDVQAQTTLPGRGIYIVTDGKKTIKVAN